MFSTKSNTWLPKKSSLNSTGINHTWQNGSMRSTWAVITGLSTCTWAEDWNVGCTWSRPIPVGAHETGIRAALTANSLTLTQGPRQGPPAGLTKWPSSHPANCPLLQDQPTTFMIRDWDKELFEFTGYLAVYLLLKPTHSTTPLLHCCNAIHTPFIPVQLTTYYAPWVLIHVFTTIENSVKHLSRPILLLRWHIHLWGYTWLAEIHSKQKTCYITRRMKRSWTITIFTPCTCKTEVCQNPKISFDKSTRKCNKRNVQLEYDFWKSVARRLQFMPTWTRLQESMSILN